MTRRRDWKLKSAVMVGALDYGTDYGEVIGEQRFSLSGNLSKVSSLVVLGYRGWRCREVVLVVT